MKEIPKFCEVCNTNQNFKDLVLISLNGKTLFYCKDCLENAADFVRPCAQCEEHYVGNELERDVCHQCYASIENTKVNSPLEYKISDNNSCPKCGATLNTWLHPKKKREVRICSLYKPKWKTKGKPGCNYIGN
tara:strand:+ start:127 stop:525 length:399 start_codon:yes stop_codon:yes gene_type:complete